jgi:hypothetical protein
VIKRFEVLWAVVRVLAGGDATGCLGTGEVELDDGELLGRRSSKRNPLRLRNRYRTSFSWARLLAGGNVVGCLMMRKVDL